MMNTICYKTRKPVVYNKGTKYETTCDTFLAYYSGKSRTELENYVNMVNAEKPETVERFGKVDWNEIECFFVKEQEEMY